MLSIIVISNSPLEVIDKGAIRESSCKLTKHERLGGLYLVGLILTACKVTSWIQFILAGHLKASTFHFMVSCCSSLQEQHCTPVITEQGGISHQRAEKEMAYIGDKETDYPTILGYGMDDV